MQISSYMFQSPYSQQVQIGRPDPAMVRAQMQEAQQAQQKAQEDANGMAQNQSSSGQIQSVPSGFFQTSSGVQQSNQASESFQAANRSANIQAYVDNSLSS